METKSKVLDTAAPRVSNRATELRIAEMRIKCRVKRTVDNKMSLLLFENPFSRTCYQCLPC
eukprot:6454017-Amphidinium_carterae.1